MIVYYRPWHGAPEETARFRSLQRAMDFMAEIRHGMDCDCCLPAAIISTLHGEYQISVSSGEVIARIKVAGRREIYFLPESMAALTRNEAAKQIKEAMTSPQKYEKYCRRHTAEW